MEFYTNIGQFSLTPNQISNWAPIGIWIRISYYPDGSTLNIPNNTVIGVSNVESQQSDIDLLTSQLMGLPDTIPQSYYIANFNFNTFWDYVYYNFSAQAAYALAGYEVVIQSMWYYPNISGIRPFIQGLVGQTLSPGNYVVQQSDMDVIVQGFALQGVTI